MPLPAASRIVSLVVWTAMVSMPLGGLAADRLGRPGLMVVLGTGGAALAGALLVWGADPAACCVTLGAFIGLPAGALLALPARAVPAGEVAWSLGWFMTVYYILLTVTQLVAGYIRQGSGSDAAAVLFGCALLLATVPGLIPVMLVQRRPALAAAT